jgi:hypothetical protein
MGLWKVGVPASHYKPIAYGRDFHPRPSKKACRCTKEQKAVHPGRFDPDDTAKDLMLIIKPDASAKYKAVVDALDETTINGVTHYAFTDLEKAEKDALVSLHIL